ncbi:MAG TPA: transglutaminase-like domain-containing protein [Pirellulales bacterium]|jgi:hypothetical protein
MRLVPTARLLSVLQLPRFDLGQALLIVLCFVLAGAASPASAQFGVVGEEDHGPKLGPEVKQRFEVGMVVTTSGGECTGIVATTPIPIDWPEQTVEVVKEDVSDWVRRVTYRDIGGTVKQMVVAVPQIPAGQQMRCVTTFEIIRRPIIAPEETSMFVIPKKPDRQAKLSLAPSVKIESRDPKIVKLAKEITEEKETAWEKVEAIYDWVREHVKYQNGPLKGALAALKDETGDCEELTSLFIAMCRAINVPARTVWVPGHCYPEFYLEDGEGKGHWFPCQAAGTRSFGGIDEKRAILQKGDNFTVPESPKKKMRYVSEFLKGDGGQPQVQWIRQGAPLPP